MIFNKANDHLTLTEFGIEKTVLLFNFIFKLAIKGMNEFREQQFLFSPLVDISLEFSGE